MAAGAGAGGATGGEVEGGALGFSKNFRSNPRAAERAESRAAPAVSGTAGRLESPGTPKRCITACRAASRALCSRCARCSAIASDARPASRACIARVSHATRGDLALPVTRRSSNMRPCESFNAPAASALLACNSSTAEGGSVTDTA